ncbi:MAG: Fe-S protein [Candidatus Rokubacteria bacterium]|nr:Fe-S protein [Candidatus Rokubacteria bacterium]
MRLFSHRRRAVHLGPYPLERLARAQSPPALDRATLPRLDAGRGAGDTPTPGAAFPDDGLSVAPAMAAYFDLYRGTRDGAVAPARAPVPDDPAARAANLKSAAYFLDASMIGTCEVPVEAWAGERLAHTHALVIAQEYAKEPEPGSPGRAWMRNAQPDRAHLRAAEVAVVLAGYMRNLGWSARAHFAGASDVDLELLLVQAGLARVESERLANPYLGDRYRAAAVTTDYAVEPDRPLAARSLAGRWRSHGPGWWLGAGGARPGWKRLADDHRPLHRGPYPMERIPRAPRPTTLIVPEEIRRVPKRGNLFTRALHGDLGERPKHERTRFAYKHPYAMAMMPLIRGMVPLQDGPVAERRRPALDEPRANAQALKALGYWFGADMVGICETPAFAWYSHHDDGRPIEPYHRSAVVMLIDQGYETMEGASGDDWISGAQSMRAYLRGALIAGVMAAHLRGLGYGARPQTNADSDVLHIPLILLAGLGEMSRIGELVLNPFVGPRFKSVVVTTDLPLEPDPAIDFGLQDFCGKCTKCARECPCLAIPFGDKVMFNGYETWKPDAERCTRYRVTNPRGSACGRCMKMCPWNFEGLLVHRFWLWLAIKVPAVRGLLARLDDRVGHGRRNPVKRWWFDLEWIDGVAVRPPHGANERDLRPDLVVRPEDMKIALYPPELLPPPGAREPVPVDRRAGLRAGATAETPVGARSRLGRH